MVRRLLYFKQTVIAHDVESANIYMKKGYNDLSMTKTYRDWYGQSFSDRTDFYLSKEVFFLVVLTKYIRDLFRKRPINTNCSIGLKSNKTPTLTTQLRVNLH
jgi:hypothetical protein